MVRATMLGAVSLLLAAGAHRGGGGELPGLPVLALLAVLSAPFVLVVTDRRCRLPRLLTALGIEQVLLHAALSVTSGAAACGGRLVDVGHHAVAVVHSSCPSGRTAAAGPAAADAVASAAVTTGGMSHSMTHSMSSWPMLAAHVVATLLTAVVLSRGEAAIWALADRIVPQSLPSVAPLAIGDPTTGPGAAMFRPIVSCRVDGTSPRGPPAPLVPGLA